MLNCIMKLSKPHGLFNAEKCVQYLRWIGVEVDEATAASWLDAQAAHRFVKLMKRPARQGWDWQCMTCNHQEYVEHKRGARRKKRDHACVKCGENMWAGRRRFVETIDGTVRDFRSPEERWKALDAPPEWRPDGPEGVA